ncbi:MAG: sigD 3 [Planctomycetaceae bacterium]|nr:sigD 3 [Planctomycetaceae bacterium]
MRGIIAGISIEKQSFVAANNIIMLRDNTGDRLLLDLVRQGDESAWADLIGRFEGRLLAFIESRIHNRATAEDLVQDTFHGFLISLPNYDPKTPLESFLFAIAAHKLTDHLRRCGRRPTVALDANEDSGRELAGRHRHASSLMRSKEHRGLEEQLLAQSLGTLIDGWREREEWERLKCIELLFVKGLPNKAASEVLGITEQAVANHKFAAVSKLKEAARKAGATEEQLAMLD